MKPNLFISFSGGETSAYMTKWIMSNIRDRYNDVVVVFANTGKERKETLDFVNMCDKEFGWGVVWVEAVVHHGKRVGCTHKVVSYESASRKGDPFEDVVKKYGIPNQSFPHCTRELKTNPMHSYIKSLGWKYYHTAIGIRSDESSRINWKLAKSKNYIYPLTTDFRVTKHYVRSFWASMPFNLGLKDYEGNCDACWKKSKRKLMTLAVEKPEIFGWWAEMELKYGDFVPDSRKKQAAGIVFGRKGISIHELLEESKMDFDVYTDNFVWDQDLDENFGCTESCEPF